MRWVSRLLSNKHELKDGGGIEEGGGGSELSLQIKVEKTL